MKVIIRCSLSVNGEPDGLSRKVPVTNPDTLEIEGGVIKANDSQD